MAGSEDINIERLSGVASFSTLIKNIYRAHYDSASNASAQFHNSLLKLTKAVSFYNINRPSSRFSALELRDAILTLTKQEIHLSCE